MVKDEIIAIGKKICKWWKSIDCKHVIDESCKHGCMEYLFIKNFYSKEFIEKNKDKHLITGEIIATFSYTFNGHSKEEVDAFFYKDLANTILAWNKEDSAFKSDFKYLKCNSCDELNVKLDLLLGLNEQEQDDLI